MASGRFRIALRRDIDVLDGLMLDRTAATPFQSRAWLTAWYRAFSAEPGLSPCIALVTLADDDPAAPLSERLVCALPLVRRRRLGLPLVEWADRGVTDYNLPLAGPAFAEVGGEVVTALVRQVRPFARFALRKMPRDHRGGANPIARAPGAAEEALGAFHLPLADGAEAFDEGLGRKKRRDIRRGQRLLGETGHAPTFRFAASAAERAQVFALVRRSQTARYGGTGRYLLDEPVHAGFYDTLVASPETQSLVRLAAVWIGETPVAALVALVDERHCIVTRLGMSDAPEIVKAGPGKLLVYETARWAAEAGYPLLDLSLGDNALKAWFHCERQALVKVTRYANGHF